MNLSAAVRRAALLPVVTAGVLYATVLSPPGAQAAGEASCTQAGGGVVLMFVNHPAVVPFLELSLDAGTAVVSVNGTPVGDCALGSSTEVRMSSASGFGAWQVSDAGDFRNGDDLQSHFWFGDNDPVVVLPGNPLSAVTYRSTGGTGIDLNLDAVADITAGSDFSQLTLVGTANADTIDLANGAGTLAFEGHNATLLGLGGDDTLVGGDNADVVEGGDGSDQLSGWDGADTLVPGNDVDQVYGRAPSGGNDTDDGSQDTFVVDYDAVGDVVRGDGDDALEALSPIGVSFSNGGSGNDGAADEGDTYSGISVVTTGGGSDTIETTGVSNVYSDAGNDTVVVGISSNGVQADGGDGTDALDFSGIAGPTAGVLGPNGQFVIPSFPQNLAADFEAVLGSGGTDTWTVDCTCTAEPRGGADEITFVENGGRFVAGPTADGADVVTAEDVTATADYTQRSTALSLTLDGEANDGATGEGDNLVGLTDLLGGGGADSIVGDFSANVLDGGAGNDYLNGRGGNDTIIGDLGVDRLVGGSGGDLLEGGAGSDVLLGGDGDDRLRGDAATDPVGGNDTLDGGAGDDDEYGYRGNDTFIQGSAANGQDLILGGLGTDLATYSQRSSAVRLTLNGLYDDGAYGEGDRLGGDVENLRGGKGADTLIGNGLANLLTGGGGKDILSGLGGNDTFQSVDSLVDTLLGGTGTDRAHRDTADKVNSVEQRF